VTAYNITFVGALCWNFPVLMPLLRTHVDDYDGLLPHVFMGDVTRWVLQRFRLDSSDTTLLAVLDFLELAFADATGEDRDLLSASFLENLPLKPEDGAGVRELLGSSLQNQLRKIG
jgi:hypothetical protein